MKSQILLFILAIACICMSASYQLRSQSQISLLSGAEPRSSKVRFGLNVGLNYSNLTGTDGSKFIQSFYLGTYNDIQLRKNSGWYLHNGARLKSDLGAQGIGVYPMNDPNLDLVLLGGSIQRRLNYIHIHSLVRYKFPSHLFVEIGPMFGLLIKAKDEIVNSMIKHDDLIFQNTVTDQYKRFDTGIEAGFGYHLMNGKGLSLGARYYQGFIDVLKEKASEPVLNQSIYLFVGIPVGSGEKAQARKAAKEHSKDTRL